MSAEQFLQKRIDACNTLIECVKNDYPFNQELKERLVALKFDLQNQQASQQRGAGRPPQTSAIHPL